MAFIDVTNSDTVKKRMIALHHVQEYQVCKHTDQVTLYFVGGNCIILDKKESENFLLNIIGVHTVGIHRVR